MRKYVITTDDTTDLPQEYYLKYNLNLLHLSYVVNDVTYDSVDRSMSNEEFYEAIRNGAMPFTQQVNPENSRILFDKLVREGFDIIHIAFSSGLSGTYNSACIGAEEVRDEYPDSKITIIDSLCASMGEGLLVLEALKRQEAGMEYNELVDWIEASKLKLVHDVVADDLFHLQRGGRVSKVAAVVGSSLGVKPIIHLNEKGKLISYSKQRHKTSALKFIANNLEQSIQNHDGLTTIAISHSACPADADKLANLIRDKIGEADIIISNIGPTIGSHTGIGTVALFYFANDRSKN
ncbi:MAG: DegV family protein [Eubacteriales bacterium]